MKINIKFTTLRNFLCGTSPWQADTATVPKGGNAEVIRKLPTNCITLQQCQTGHPFLSNL